MSNYLVRYTIKYHRDDTNTDGEIEIEARDDKHARRLAQRRMDRKPWPAVFEVVRT